MNKDHDYYAVNSVDGRKLRNQRINTNRFELVFMWVSAMAFIAYTAYCAIDKYF